MITKNKLMPCSAIAAAGVLAGLPGLVEAQTAAAPVVGVNEQTLLDGQFNLVGLNLHNDIIISGSFDAVVSNDNGTSGDLSDDFSTLTENDVTLTTSLADSGSATYILEITSGSLAGTIQEVTSWTGNTITTPDDVAANGLVAGTTYAIRKAATLQQVLGDSTGPGTNNVVIGSSFAVGTADVVWVPDASGEYTKYFFQPDPVNAWRNDTDGVAVTADVPLVHADAFFVQIRNGQKTLPLSGAVKTDGLTLAVMTGFTGVANMYPEGSTLQNSGLENSLQASFASGTADVVWVPDGSGDYTKYFYQPDPLNRWFNDTASSAVASDVELPSAYFIQRRGADTNITTSAPASYSNLP